MTEFETWLEYENSVRVVPSETIFQTYCPDSTNPIRLFEVIAHKLLIYCSVSEEKYLSHFSSLLAQFLYFTIICYKIFIFPLLFIVGSEIKSY